MEYFLLKIHPFGSCNKTHRDKFLKNLSSSQLILDTNDIVFYFLQERIAFKYYSRKYYNHLRNKRNGLFLYLILKILLIEHSEVKINILVTQFFTRSFFYDPFFIKTRRKRVKKKPLVKKLCFIST